MRAYRYIHHKLAQIWYMSRYDHTEGYRRLMKYRIKHFGPEQAVGGFDQDIGKLQFDFLRGRGLNCSNTLLDIGCGSLRGGEHYIEYLNQGNYTGMDISAAAIEEGINRIDELICLNNPSFIINDNLKFEDNDLMKSYDYAIAQSVFTHLPQHLIHECLRNIEKVVSGTFYATFFDKVRLSPKDFQYNPESLIELAESHGYSTELVSKREYPHPRGQRMMKFEIG